MLLSIGFTEIAIIVCGSLAVLMVVLSIVASILSRSADKKTANKPAYKPADAIANSVPEQVTTDDTESKPKPAEEPEIAATEEPIVEEAPATEGPVVEGTAEEVVSEEPAVESAPTESAEQVAVDVAETAAVVAPQSEAPAMESKVVIRYRFSFLAKLIQSGEEMQTRFGEVRDFMKSYKKVRVSVSWRKVRVSSGRNVLAVALFKGRRVCIAYALDPADYAESKYGGKDVSDKKRFEKTPYMLRLSSKRKVKYAKELFAAVAEKYGLIKVEEVHTDAIMPYRTTDELVEEGLVKLVRRETLVPVSAPQEEISADVPAEQVAEKVDEAPAEKPVRPRGKKGFSEAPKKQEIEQQEKITAAEAAEIADEAAEKVLEKKGSQINRNGVVKKAIVNVDTLSQNYSAGESVTIESLIEKGIVPSGTNYVKVLARGLIDKPLHVHADDYSMDAVKMIVATGGVAIKHIENE